MKPDQHKKKRSAQYKRKHGTVPNKEATSAKPVSTSNISGSACASSAVDSKLSSSSTTAAVKSQGAATSKVCVSAPSQRSHDEGFSHEEESEEVRFFSRRKLESNWSRYEPLEDFDDDYSYDGLKGADYKTLLNQTGDASSQFRFKDEQLWEEDERDTDKEGIVQGFPAIDCHDLADRLKAIPLNVRLNIESCFFEPSVLKNLNEAATRHKEKLDRKPAKEAWTSLRPDSEPAGLENGKMFLTNSDISTAEEQDDILLDSEDEDTAVESTLPTEGDFENHEDYFQVTDVHESRTNEEDTYVEHIESAMAELVTDSEVGSANIKLECSKVEKETVKPKMTDLEFHDVQEESQITQKPKTENLTDFTPSQPNACSPTTATRLTGTQQDETDISKSLYNRPVMKPKEPLHSKLHVKAAETEEDDLDFLLSLENPVQMGKPVINGGLKEGDEGVSSLGMERSSTSKPQGGPVKSAAVKTTTSLDWLDSLLDD